MTIKKLNQILKLIGGKSIKDYVKSKNNNS